MIAQEKICPEKIANAKIENVFKPSCAFVVRSPETIHFIYFHSTPTLIRNYP